MRPLSWFRLTLAALAGILIPPRRSEYILQRLTLEALREIALREHSAAKEARIRILLPYPNRAVKALTWEIKYRRNKKALALAAGILYEELLGSMEDGIGKPLLIPVPMHPSRRSARGYNQTELICEQVLSLGKRAGPALPLKYAPRVLKRVSFGVPQQQLPRALRLANMKNAMRADPSVVGGRACIVLDDIVTTGATLLESRRALCAAGAKRVYLLALAG